MISIRHPLLDELRKFNGDAAMRFPADFHEGIGQMGLLLESKFKTWGYWCTPKNALTFASTGGDGVNFSFIVQNEEVTEESAVIVTVPCHFGEPDTANWVVADSLRNFLRFGLHRGYFAMEQIAFERDLTLKVYSSPEWQPTEDWHYSVGYQLGENGQRVRDFLVERFALTPLAYTVGEFDALQNQFKPHLEYPDNDA